jgi:competence protein ComEA
MRDGKITKTEWILLALTGVFLCVLLILFFQDRTRMEEAGVETEIEVPQEEILPDLSPLNLNTATQEELAQLPGIGEELARRIVEHREANGPFETIEELMEVSGIGEGKFADLEGRITVNGEDAE